MTGASDANATITLTYDSGGRLASAATSGPAGTQPLVTLTYGYNAAGDRTGATDSLSGTGGAGQGLSTYSYDLAHRLTMIAQSFGGNAGPQVVFGYDSGNRLTSIARTIGGVGRAVKTSRRVPTSPDKIGSPPLPRPDATPSANCRMCKFSARPQFLLYFSPLSSRGLL